ncbi:SDR family oxidoreductase [Amaricoccus macauensis]|uniref:SDR family oxidoreductase n=1 Tax=Amaricoccus macauensis TaxID=57001 RepID=UPI003C7A90DA
MRLEGKSIIITGASSGIGAAAARIFAEEGASLVLSARRAALLEQLAAELRSAGAQALTLAGDVRQEDVAKRLVGLAEAEFGGLDGAFNNAGTVGDMGPVVDMSAETWSYVQDINLKAGFFGAKYQIPAMQRRGGGSIVFTSSFVGHTIGLPGMVAYASAKAGLVGMTQVLAAEHGGEGIRVNSLLPGGTRTEMAGDDPGTHAFVRNLHALKRMAEPEEIARAALFLLSDEASFVTGAAMLADGGNSICKT